ncbi:hypothetical protein [Pontibacter pamirensis]|uniref:hypothetical protein n=1 Tax=Pontibacter pamirensis TaxID=2562824 RepID=UPI001F3F1EB4|nr:hypothetical protein [Pontibacter pamirensis]
MAGHWLLDINTGSGKLQFPGVLMPLESGSEQAASCTAPEPSLAIPMPATDLSSLQLSLAATLNPA